MNIPDSLLPPNLLTKDKVTVICQSPKLVKQIRKVLRLENGDHVDIVDGQSNIYHCVFAKYFARRRARFLSGQNHQCREKLLELTGPSFIVALPVIKQARFEWALEKLTEIRRRQNCSYSFAQKHSQIA